MTKYFKRRKPISYLDQITNEELLPYIDTYNDLEVYTIDETPNDDLGDFDYNKYTEEDDE